MPTPRIMQEVDCRGASSGSKLGKKPQTSSNIYMSPVGVEDEEESRNGVVGNGLRTLPRLSESLAVHNFKDINSDC